MHLIEGIVGSTFLILAFAFLGIIGVIVFLAWLMKKAIDENKE